MSSLMRMNQRTEEDLHALKPDPLVLRAEEVKR
jgi:hypothetical protein